MANDTTSWTTKDLEALEAAIAKGVQRVKYTDKEIEYRSLDDMFKLRDRIKKELGLKSNTLKQCKTYYNKGLC